MLKTFKLISLTVLEDNDEDIIAHEIPLLDGLIIDREDEKNQWVVESFLDVSYYEFFSNLESLGKPIMLHAKITKETNQPATFMSSIIDINKMEKNINVLFIGELIDRKKGQIEKTLKKLIEEGYQGKKLLDMFKDKV